MSSRFVIPTIVLSAASLTSCAASPMGGQSPDEPVDYGRQHRDMMREDLSPFSDEQIAALDDAHVSEAEYTVGYHRWVSCVDEAGFTLEELGRPSNKYDVGIPIEAVPVSDECYEREFSYIDMTWQVEHPPETELATWLSQCLEAEGLDGSGDEAILRDRVDAEGLDILTCIETHDGGE